MNRPTDSGIISALLLALGCLGCSSEMPKAESEARAKLREMGAINVIDTKGTHVATLMMTAPSISQRMDEAIPLVANFKHLTHLEATNGNLTDEHAKTIGRLKRINSLVLSGTQIGDEAVKQLANLKRLDTLYVDNTNITANAMDVIGEIRTLKIVDISDTPVASNLAPLAKLKNLEWLLVNNLALDHQAIELLSELPKLGRISIAGCTIASDDLTMLKGAKPGLIIDGEASAGSDAGGPEHELPQSP